MKLVIDGDVFCWQRHGGISRIYSRIIPRLAQFDHQMDIKLVIPKKDGIKLPEGLKQYVVWTPQLSASLRPWRFWHRVAPTINRVMADACWRRNKTDLFLSTYFTLPPIRAPLICVVYDMIVELFPESFDNAYADDIRQRKRASVEKAEIVLCISQYTRNDVIRLLNVPKKKCRVIHLAGNIQAGEQKNSNSQFLSGRDFFLFVGNHLAAYKNFNFLLERFLSEKSGMFSDFDLVVVSPLPAGEAVSEFCGDALTTGRVKFIRNCDDHTLAELYTQCSVFIYPSLYEGFGIPLLEALSVGSPVVCSDIPVFREVGGDVAYYFDPRSPAELFLAMESAVRDGRARDKVAARKAHAARFSWDRTARQFLQAFYDVCG